MSAPPEHRSTLTGWATTPNLRTCGSPWRPLPRRGRTGKPPGRSHRGGSSPEWTASGALSPHPCSPIRSRPSAPSPGAGASPGRGGQPGLPPPGWPGPSPAPAHPGRWPWCGCVPGTAGASRGSGNPGRGPGWTSTTPGGPQVQAAGACNSSGRWSPASSTADTSRPPERNPGVEMCHPSWGTTLRRISRGSAGVSRGRVE